MTDRLSSMMMGRWLVWGGANTGLDIAGDNRVAGVIGSPDVVWSCPVALGSFVCWDTHWESKLHILHGEDVD